jgi:hypothetical protein
MAVRDGSNSMILYTFIMEYDIIGLHHGIVNMIVRLKVRDGSKSDCEGLW